MAAASAPHADVLVAEVRRVLAGAGDPARAVEQQRYMKSVLPYRGISSPQLRLLLRPVLAAHRLETREEWERVVRLLWDTATHREEWYAAIAVARHPHHRVWIDPASLGLFRHMVERGAWWDVVDEVAQHLVGAVVLGHRDEASGAMREWMVADDLWVRRTTLLCQNRHRAATDMALLRDVLDANLEGSPFGSEFFIRKAMGWALREYSRTDPAWVQAYVTSRATRLSGLTRREALKRVG